MYELALGLSIMSSLLVIVYLLNLFFGLRKPEKEITITITGRILTTTVNQTVGDNELITLSKPSKSSNRAIDGEVIDAKKLQSTVEGILKNLK